MLPLKSFKLLQPKSLAQLRHFLSEADQKTKIIAGGTDLIPNLKHGLYDITSLIALSALDELRGKTFAKEAIRLGAMVSLEQVAHDRALGDVAPALGKAARHIASPQIRAMGTVGGNLCLDTRCAYFNQTQFWRSALGYCLKKDGTACHVVKSGKRCVAASSNDLATILLAYDAKLSILAPAGMRTIALRDLYTANGENNKVLTSKELITEVTIPLKPQCYAGFAKLRHRESFDFPLLSIGALVELENERLRAGRLVINALVARPKIIDLAQFVGSLYEESLVDRISQLAVDKCQPQSNIADDQGWRRAMILPMAKRAFFDARPFRDKTHAI